MFENDKRKINTELNLGDQLVREIYINRSQKLDIRGEGITDPEKLMKLMRLDWMTIKKKATKIASLEGNAAIFYLMSDGEKYPGVGSVVSYNEFGGMITQLRILSSRFETVEGVDYPIHLEWNLVGGAYVLSRFYLDEDGMIVEVSDTFTYPKNETPIIILKNNVDEQSDVEFYGVGELKDKINYWAKQITQDWANAGKARPVQRALYGSGTTVDSFMKQYNPNNEVMTQSGINSKLSGDAVGSGGMVAGVATAVAVVGSLITAFRDAVMLHNVTQSNGTNKHGLEIALSHQPEIDNLMEQKVMRDRVYTMFLSEFFGTPTMVDVQMSDVTTSVIDGMQADLAVKLAKIKGE